MVQNPLKNVELLKVLGSGAYGTVFLACSKSPQSPPSNPNTTFALKIVKKPQKSKDIQHLKDEIQVLKNLKNPFFCEMLSCSESKSKIFISMEFLGGGELFTLAQDLQNLDEKNAKFYLAEIVLGLEYLHSANVLYRDLKPENVMIDRTGHCKLVDFGLSKFNFGGKLVNPKTSTFCGTLPFMAPEMHNRVPYGYPIDLWALGCLAFDLLTGAPPFYTDSNEDTIFLIKHGSVNVPKNLSRNCEIFLRKLLMKNEEKRWGLNEVKGSAFFEDIDWGTVLLKGYQPPYVPMLKGDMDVSNFDKKDTELNVEEVLGELDSDDEEGDEDEEFMDFEFENEDMSSSGSESL